jgi:N-acetyl-1-D-myo-inositol-2-amino-2-deoxy-alpha-D-glucopyranoside deacetylase
LLLVHAHPDDEAIATGATMARYAAEGVRVHVVTCTRGERGEIVDGQLAHLLDGGPDALGKHREGELAAALSEMGVREHEWLGGAGRWWDSGMAGSPDNDDPRAFHRADATATTRAMVEIIRRVRPTVMVSDNENGTYGHPDHIQSHRVTSAALGPAADPAYAPELGEPWQVAKVYWIAIRRVEIMRLIEEAGLEIGDEPPGVADEMITTRIDGRAQLPAKVAPLRAHRSQVDLKNGFFAQKARLPEFGLEHFQLVRGARRLLSSSAQEWEDDLFAGAYGPTPPA